MPEAPDDVHKNAHLTPCGRVLLVERFESDEPHRAAVSVAGVSRQTTWR